MSIRMNVMWMTVTFLAMFTSSILMIGMIYTHKAVLMEFMFHWVIPIIVAMLIGELWFEYRRNQLAHYRAMVLLQIKDEVERQGLSWGPQNSTTFVQTVYGAGGDGGGGAGGAYGDNGKCL